MSTIRTRTVRLASGVAAAGLLLVPLSGCSGDPASDVAAELETGAAETGAAETSAAETSTPAEDTGAPAEPTSGVDCTGTSCSVTLTGDAAEVEVLGNTISLGQVQDGRATIGVGDREVSCSQGESVEAGPLTLECTTVSAEAVTLTASLG